MGSKTKELTGSLLTQSSDSAGRDTRLFYQKDSTGRPDFERHQYCARKLAVLCLRIWRVRSSWKLTELLHKFLGLSQPNHVIPIQFFTVKILVSLD